MSDLNAWVKHEEATNVLRFVLRYGKRILQQRWVITEIENRTVLGAVSEWRDVPLEAESN